MNEQNEQEKMYRLAGIDEGTNVNIMTDEFTDKMFDSIAILAKNLKTYRQRGDTKKFAQDLQKLRTLFRVLFNQ